MPEQPSAVDMGVFSALVTGTTGKRKENGAYQLEKCKAIRLMYSFA